VSDRQKGNEVTTETVHLEALVRQLREACKGHPNARIPWPHRLLHEAADAIERLQGYAEGDAACPCCNGTDKCDDECTFAEDNPDDVERMLAARYALKGP